MTSQNTEILISKTKEFRDLNQSIPLNDDPIFDAEIKALHTKHPHLYVLCCLMDRQINANKAWKIPYEICRAINGWTVEEMNRITEDEYVGLFEKKRLHHYYKAMASIFKRGLERISERYNGDASMIWSGVPSSAAVITRFLEFEGCGVKIATMATNLLHRSFNVQFSDYSAIDVSPDVHILRVMYRLGLTSSETNRDLAIYTARGLYPSYPGIFDGLFWRIGKDHCHKSKPSCRKCPLNSICGHK